MSPGISLQLLLHPTFRTFPVLVFLALAVAALAALPRAVGELAGVPWVGRRRDAALGAALFVLAFALRWGLATHTLIHENHHGYHHVSSLGAVNESAESHGVPSAHILLLRLFGAVVGVADESTFLFDALLSATSVVALAAFAAQVTGSRAAGWAAAALLGLQPLAIALGPTDEFLVSGSGLCLAGMALLHAGARDGLRGTLALGTALLCLGAGAREVTLPLSALAVPALLSARTPSRRTPWRAALAVCGAMTLLLLPQAVQVLLAWRQQTATPGYFGSPALPWAFDGAVGRNAHWMGWFEPFIPRWQAWAMLGSPVLLALWCVARRDGRLALGVLLPAAVALLEGGLVRSGWFPTHLRHQLLSMALLLLPVAACVGLAARGLGPRWGAAAPAAVALLAAVSLARRPLGYRPDLPLTAEYHFFRDVLAAAPRDATAVTFDDDPLTHLPAQWIAVQRPSWSIIRAAALPSLRPGRDRPVFLMLDRACFIDRSSFPAPSEGGAAPQPMTASPYGRLLPQCARALGAAPWRVVATRPLARSRPPQFEMPSADAVVRLAVLRWDVP
jgi:hypothetical protein